LSFLDTCPGSITKAGTAANMLVQNAALKVISIKNLENFLRNTLAYKLSIFCFVICLSYLLVS